MKMRSAFIILFTLFFTIQVNSQTASNFRWLDTSFPAMERAGFMVSEMTLDEKITQLMNASPAIPRLNIPEYNWWNECLHGVARNGKATVFPQAIAFGASFDDELIFKVGTAISDEARAKFNISQAMGNYAQYAGLTFLDTKHQYFPRSSLGPGSGNLWRRSIPDFTHWSRHG